jgi:hypothetical protein
MEKEILERERLEKEAEAKARLENDLKYLRLRKDIEGIKKKKDLRLDQEE